MPTIGLIANPVSARDIRRIIANASNLQIADRVNIVMRVLTAAHSLGVERVLVMPDKGGIRALLQRHLSRGHSQHQRWPVVEYLEMEPTSTVEDTFQAARLMRAAGVAAIVVLGGLAVHLGHHPHPAALRLLAPIAPGMVRPVSIAHWQVMPADQPFTVQQQGGVVALDGERELAFDAGDRVHITLRENAFPTVDVARCMHIAACEGLLRLPSTP
jgi:hypothetical protein